MGNAYVDGGKLVIPSDNLMTVLREGGKRCNTGKGQQTFKAQTQSGIIVDQVAWPVEVGSAGKKGTIEWAPIKAQLIDEEDFEKHMEVAASAGFTLFVKRAKIGMAKYAHRAGRSDHHGRSQEHPHIRWSVCWGRRLEAVCSEVSWQLR
jgi:hypothetical protein